LRWNELPIADALICAGHTAACYSGLWEELCSRVRSDGCLIDLKGAVQFSSHAGLGPAYLEAMMASVEAGQSLSAGARATAAASCTVAGNGSGRLYRLESGADTLQLGQRVTGLDNFLTGKRENLQQVAAQVGLQNWRNFRLLEGDIRDLATCMQACQGMDYVLHQAALGSVTRPAGTAGLSP
jgi:hypothetical protein